MNYPKTFALVATLLASFLPFIASASNCNGQGLKSGTYTMAHDNLMRTYRVHVPRGFNNSTPAPLVAMFHGWGGNEDAFIGNRKVRSEADKRGYILVAPRGIGSEYPDDNPRSWSFSGSTTGIDGVGANICDDSITPDYSYPSCNDKDIAKNTCSWTHCQYENSNDVEFAVALVQVIADQMCVDTNRVYAMGGSNGGMYAWELGQNPASAATFRAIAPLIGLPHRGYVEGPADGLDIPALVITGTRDNTVPPGDWEDSNFTTTSNGNDRYYYTGATAITRSWADTFDSCDTDSDLVGFDDGNRKTDCRTYCSNGPGGWPAVLDCRARMGHSYSLGWSWKLILNFFDAHGN